jgi:hypothetical protein
MLLIEGSAVRKAGLGDEYPRHGNEKRGANREANDQSHMGADDIIRR